MTASPTSSALASDDFVPAAQPARNYAAARRHSSRVRWLRIGIPVGSVLAITGVVLAAYVNPLSQIPGLTLGTVSISGSKIAMENPRLTGFRKDSRPYEVTAKAAFQDIRKPTIVELKDMQGRVTIDASGTTADLVSAGGLFDTSKEFLELSQNIRITTSRGEEATLSSAAVDFKAGTVDSREPVRISTSQGTIEAEGIRISDNGSSISFTGRVRTEFRRLQVALPDAPPSGPGQAARVSQAE